MKQSKRKKQMLMALGLLGTTSAMSVGQGLTQDVHADTTNQTAGGFDLTKQATTAPFPVMFDRPSGVNAAALAGSLRTLGTSSDLYKSAVQAVPELANSGKMNTLLNDALSDNASVSGPARTTILKLINWYNGLGGFQTKTQSGEAYTTSNLDKPINTIAVGFADATSNKSVSDKIQQKFGNVTTVGDVMTALDSYKSGISAGYVSAFDAYKTKVNAPNADIAKLSELTEIQPLLNAYEKMYSDGASAIRTQLLSTNGVKEAAVAFFESAVITGRVDNSDGGTSDHNTVADKKVTTRWVDANGKELAPNETGTNYKGEKIFDGYVLRESRTDNGVKTYIYEKVTEKTRWVDESGNVLKPETSGTHPDKEGDDIPGYKLIKTETTKNGANTVTVNTYKKNAPAERKPDTYWFDTNGVELKPVAKEQTLPDNDGVSDITGYKLLRAYQVTKESLEGDLKGSKFQIGDTINIYEKVTELEKPKPKPEEPKPNKNEVKIITKWVDEQGKQLKDPQDGAHPDTEGDDVPGYRILRTIKDEKGNITNVYEKIPAKHTTNWVDTNGNKLKDSVEGEFPDKEGDDVPGYTFVETKTDEKGNITNVYKKKVITTWVDTNGNKLKDPKDGEYPDKEGDDVPGYTFVETKTDENGNVTNVYKKKVITTWVDENGNKLKDPEDGEHPDKEGDDVPGYTFVETKTDENGNVTNVYKKKVITTWVDENGNKLKDSEDGEHPDKEGDDVPGYKLIRTDKDKDGNTTNVYHKIVTTWVDTDGKTLQKSKDGEHPDKEGDDITGYTFVTTNTKDNGDIENVYKKNQVKKVITHWVDKEGKRLAEDETGENFAKEKTIKGYKLVDVRSSKDGTEKFYVYEPVTEDTPKEQPKQLPKTGDAGSGLATLAGALMMGIGGLTVKRKKKDA